ncbi:HutD/Ves family protein, partial [Xanthomonas citri]
ETETETGTSASASGSAGARANVSTENAETETAADAWKGMGSDASGAESVGEHAAVDGSLSAGERVVANASRSRRVDLVPPYQRVRFAGEDAVEAVLLDGPTQDFNLMWRRDLLRTELLHRPLVGTMLFFADSGSAWAIHLLAGQASFGRDSGLPSLAAGDTAWLSAATRTRYVLDGGGELLAIRVSPLLEP